MYLCSDDNIQHNGIHGFLQVLLPISVFADTDTELFRLISTDVIPIVLCISCYRYDIHTDKYLPKAIFIILKIGDTVLDTIGMHNISKNNICIDR